MSEILALATQELGPLIVVIAGSTTGFFALIYLVIALFKFINDSI